MRSITATVLDPTHLELTEPLTVRSGAQIDVTVHVAAHRTSRQASADGEADESYLASAEQFFSVSPRRLRADKTKRYPSREELYDRPRLR